MFTITDCHSGVGRPRRGVDTFNAVISNIHRCHLYLIQCVGINQRVVDVLKIERDSINAVELFWLRIMRLTAFGLGSLFLIFALIEALWNPFEHANEKFLAATGVALVFLAISRNEHESEDREETEP